MCRDAQVSRAQDAQERQKSPKPFCPAVAIQGRMNAASGWIHTTPWMEEVETRLEQRSRSGLRPYCRSVPLAALRFPCSRWQVRGSPSVASPFSGAKVHWTFAFIRFTPTRTPLGPTSPALALGSTVGDLQGRRKVEQCRSNCRGEKNPRHFWLTNRELGVTNAAWKKGRKKTQKGCC